MQDDLDCLGYWNHAGKSFEFRVSSSEFQVWRSKVLVGLSQYRSAVASGPCCI